MSDPKLKSLTRLAPSDSGLAWLDSLRRNALACFDEHGVPTRREENWKGTNFSPLSAMKFSRVGPSRKAASLPDLPDDLIGHEEPILVFVDGVLNRDASRLDSLPKGIRAESLADILRDSPELVEGRLGSLVDLKLEPLAALQTAFLSDGAVLVVEPGAQIDQPIQIRFISTGDSTDDHSQEESGMSAAFPRLLVLAEKDSSVTLFQEHLTLPSAPGFTAFVAEFQLAENAQVESIEIQAQGSERIHFTSVHAELGRNARFNSHVVTIANGLVRSELAVTLAEPHAQTTCCGLFLGRDRAHLDHFTTIDHAAERCTSDQEYRGVLANRSKGVFRGRVLVRPDAQHTTARQSNPNLLLSDRATIDTKPQLEIYADDIRASHGSTIGQLDANALFFLRARGLDETSAKQLLTGAFVQGVIDRIANPTLRQATTAHTKLALSKLTAEADDRRENPS